MECKSCAFAFFRKTRTFALPLPVGESQGGGLKNPTSPPWRIGLYPHLTQGVVFLFFNQIVETILQKVIADVPPF